MKHVLTLSPRVATLSEGSTRKCCLLRLASAATSRSISRSATKGSRREREDMVMHSCHIRSPQSYLVVTSRTHTAVSLSCLVSGVTTSKQCPCSMVCCGPLCKQQASSKCRYLQNLPGWHRLPAVAPPHEASPDMSGRRPCRAQTDQSRGGGDKIHSFPWTRLSLAQPSKELITTLNCQVG